MTAALYEVTIRHQRREPVRYGFGHRTAYWFVDVDALPRLPWPLRPLGRILPRDHFGDPALSLRNNVERLLAEAGIDLHGGRILLLTQPRVLSYVFNPLSLFWCHNDSGELAAIIAEVHNTYGGRHCYVLHPGQSVRKEFYVSPFFPVDGDYRMRLPVPGERLGLTITLHRPDGSRFTATMTGRRRPLDTAQVWRAAWRHPWAPLVNSARIRVHGIRLYLRGLPVLPRKAHS